MELELAETALIFVPKFRMQLGAVSDSAEGELALSTERCFTYLFKYLYEYEKKLKWSQPEIIPEIKVPGGVCMRKNRHKKYHATAPLKVLSSEF